MKGISAVERSIRVQPSRRAAEIEVYHGGAEGGTPTLIKSGQEISGVCGEAIKDISELAFRVLLYSERLVLSN